MKIALYLISITAILSLVACTHNDGKLSGRTGLVADSLAVATAKNAIDTASDNTSTTAGPDQNQLVGDWERTDGEYTLRIYSASPEGKLDATYFNPGSIHVARAEWSKTADGSYQVVLELQDINYPGSTYTLQYNPANDQLKGIYFQAVEKINYDVGFTRKQ